MATRLLSGTFHLCCPLSGPALHCQGQAGPWRQLSSQGRRGSALLSWPSTGWRTWGSLFPGNAQRPLSKIRPGNQPEQHPAASGLLPMLSEDRRPGRPRSSEEGGKLDVGTQTGPSSSAAKPLCGWHMFVSLDTCSAYLVTTVFWSILALRSSFCCWRTWIFSSRIMFFSAWKGCSVRRPLAGPSDRKETSALGGLSRSVFCKSQCVVHWWLVKLG